MRTHTIHKQAPILQMLTTQDKRHTASPWQFKQSGDDFILKGLDGTTVFRIRAGTLPMNHDARLIESAPIMIDALQAVADSIEGSDSLLARQVRDAISKATE